MFADNGPVAAVEEVRHRPALGFQADPERPCRLVETRRYETNLPSAMTPCPLRFNQRTLTEM